MQRVCLGLESEDNYWFWKAIQFTEDTDIRIHYDNKMILNRFVRAGDFLKRDYFSEPQTHLFHNEEIIHSGGREHEYIIEFPGAYIQHSYAKIKTVRRCW